MVDTPGATDDTWRKPTGAQAGSTATEVRCMAAVQIQKMSYSHDRLVDLMIANPHATNRELGEAFGYSEVWISRLKCSGIFREKLYARTADMVDPVLQADLKEGFEIVTRRSLEVLMDKLSAPSAAVPDDLVIAAANLGAKAGGHGGFGAKVVTPPPAPPTDRIERLAHRLEALGRPPALDQEIIDVPARPVSDSGSVRAA